MDVCKRMVHRISSNNKQVELLLFQRQYEIFLKSFLEFEYRLFIEKKDISNTANITRFIQKYVSDVKLERESSSELVFGIKRGASQYIGPLINALDGKRGDISINSYGLSMTTIEEVFLRFIFYLIYIKKSSL